MYLLVQTWLDWEVTWHWLIKYLPEEGKILDAGGAGKGGNYTIKLAKEGYEVVLVDINQERLQKSK